MDSNSGTSESYVGSGQVANFCFQLLLLFFVTSVVILFMDIITDILTAVEFFCRGDKYWGVSTLIPIFAPFVAKVAVTLVGLARCFRKTSAEPALGTSKQGDPKQKPELLHHKKYVSIGAYNCSFSYT